LQRLAIAELLDDKVAARRAYSNLGNAQVFLGKYTSAAQYYL
jgi:G-protein signaling modulator 1